MKKAGVFILTMMLFPGCIPPQTAEEPETFPVLIHQTPLPPFPVSLTAPELRFDVKVFVDDLGNVREVILLTSSGNPQWDKNAEDCIATWRFTPAQAKGKPVGLWIRQTIVLQFREPVFMDLAEIICATEGLADSAYRLLEAGESFSGVARRLSLTAGEHPDGSLGRVDIRSYPIHVQEQLKKLRIGEYTSLMKLGNRFVIFLRMPPANNPQSTVLNVF